MTSDAKHFKWNIFFLFRDTLFVFLSWFFYKLEKDHLGFIWCQPGTLLVVLVPKWFWSSTHRHDDGLLSGHFTGHSHPAGHWIRTVSCEVRPNFCSLCLQRFDWSSVHLLDLTRSFMTHNQWKGKRICEKTEKNKSHRHVWNVTPKSAFFYTVLVMLYLSVPVPTWHIVLVPIPK